MQEQTCLARRAICTVASDCAFPAFGMEIRDLAHDLANVHGHCGCLLMLDVDDFVLARKSSLYGTHLRGFVNTLCQFGAKSKPSCQTCLTIRHLAVSHTRPAMSHFSADCLCMSVSTLFGIHPLLTVGLRGHGLVGQSAGSRLLAGMRIFSGRQQHLPGQAMPSTPAPAPPGKPI